MSPVMISLAVGLLILGYALLLGASPYRQMLGDGWKCLKRYPEIWRTIAWLGFANAVFQLAVKIRLQMALPDYAPDILIWGRTAWRDPAIWLHGSPESVWWMTNSGLRTCFAESWLPAFEGVHGLFNNVITTFPVALFAALGLLFNVRSSQTLLFRTLRRRFRVGAWPLLFVVWICAFAVIVKGILYFQPSIIPDVVFYQWGPVIALPAFAFEYLFGLTLQVYLILLVYAWVRGLTFEKGALRQMAIRRVGAASKWAFLVMLLSTLLIDLPLILKNFPQFARWFADEPETIDRRLFIARIVMASLLIPFCSMQAWLTLHGETLGRAFHGHWMLMRKSFPAIAWFVAVAAVHLFAIYLLRSIVLRGLGEETALGNLWTIFWPWIAAPVVGWLLATWICLFKKIEPI